MAEPAVVDRRVVVEKGAPAAAVAAVAAARVTVVAGPAVPVAHLAVAVATPLQGVVARSR